MTTEEMRAALHQAPFQPFALHLAAGHKIKVPHPDFAAITGDGLTALITSPTSGGHTVVDLLLVTRIEVPVASGRGR